MLIIAAISIGIVIIVGFMMASKRSKREKVPPVYKIVHGGFTFIGAALVLVAALMGDNRLWTNIILAAIIVILGIVMALGKVNKSTAKPVLYTHASIGIICYAIFLYLVIASMIA